jgi:BCD family chlorophyll transporter-like MFS transporter
MIWSRTFIAHLKTQSLRFMPFADAASHELPIGKLLRLSLFQAVIGMTTSLLVGTLNRVMIVELGMPAWWVALAFAIPLVFAPLRALIGYRSDTHPSALGLKRIPYLWMGTLLLFGGLAIMPFALLLLSDPPPNTEWLGQIGVTLAFVLVGFGMQVTQTAGLALASDLSTEEKRPRVVALLYSMLLIGMIGSSVLYGVFLSDFTPTHLIQVIQGSAVIVVVFNLMSLWKQEARSTKRGPREENGFQQNWQKLMAQASMRRFLWTVAIGTAAFSMQDIILEPFGAEVLGLDVSMTSALTALSAGGSLLAFFLASQWLGRGVDACRVASAGVVLGLPAFAFVIFSAPLDSPNLFRVGTFLIGFSGGLFSVGMLVTAMSFNHDKYAGMVLGAWGAVQAMASGLAMAAGGFLRDTIASLANSGALGTSLDSPATAYSFVYHIEIYMLFVVLIALGPLVRNSQREVAKPQRSSFGLAEFPS